MTGGMRLWALSVLSTALRPTHHKAQSKSAHMLGQLLAAAGKLLVGQHAQKYRRLIGAHVQCTHESLVGSLHPCWHARSMLDDMYALQQSFVCAMLAGRCNACGRIVWSVVYS